MKRIFFAAVVLIAALFSTAGAQAHFTTDHEYIVVFRPGISWEDAAAEVQGWGSSYHLTDITSRGEKRYLQRLMHGLRGEFWIGGYQDSADQWRWVTGEPWGFNRWARRHPGNDSEADREHYLGIRSRFHGRRWMWKDEWNAERVSGFIVERDLSPQSNGTVTPIPAAAWLFGSGMAVLAGLRLARRRN